MITTRRGLQFTIACIGVVTLLGCCSNSESTEQDEYQEPDNQNSRPEMSVQEIEETIVGKTIYWGAYDDSAWRFGKGEYRDLKLMESTYEGDGAVIVIDITTREGGGSDYSGRLRLNYEWIVDVWHLQEIEVITFKKTPGLPPA